MKRLFDKSVLIAALVESHPFHRRAQPWLDRALAGEFEWVVSAHSLAECHAVLTALPLTPRLSSETASRLVNDNIASRARIASERWGDGLSDGSIHDALP